MKHDDITLKSLLEARLGNEKAARVLNRVNEAVQEGKQGEELETYFAELLENEGYNPGDIKSTTTHAIPSS